MLKIKILMPVIALIAAGTLVGSLSLQVWNPSWNPFQVPAQRQLEKALTNLFFAETFQLNGEIDFEIKPSAQEESLTISLRFQSKVDQKEKENRKTEGTYNLGLGEEGFELSVEAELKTIGQDFYFKLGSLPPIPFLGALLSGLENQWVKIDEKTLSQLSEEQDFEQTKKAQKELQEDLTNLFKKRRLFEVEKQLKDEVIAGEKTSHFMVKIPKEELKTFLPELLEIIARHSPEEQKIQLQEMKEEFPGKFEEVYDKIGEINFEVWLGKKDNYLKKLKGEQEIDLSLFESLKGSAGENAKIKIRFNMGLSEFNQKMAIEPPLEFKALEEIFPEISEGIPSLPLFLPGQ